VVVVVVVIVEDAAIAVDICNDPQKYYKIGEKI